MRSYSALIFTALLNLMPLIATASAFPGETLMRPQSGLFWLTQGFRLGTDGTSWSPIEDDQTLDESLKKSKTSLESLTYLNPTLGEHARLHVNVETLRGRSSLELYSRRWTREYSQYGMHVLSSKPTRMNNHPTLIYDLLSKAQDVQIRQIIQVHRGKAVVLTCSDAKANFQKTSTACNRMAQNLIWSEIKTK